MVGLGLPALAALIFLAVLVLGVACWVIGSEDRTEHVSQMLLAWRGNANCLARNDVDSPSAPAVRLRRRLWPRRLVISPFATPYWPLWSSGGPTKWLAISSKEAWIRVKLRRYHRPPGPRVQPRQAYACD